MPSISLHRDFVIDLAKPGDAQLTSRVFRKVFTEAGTFRSDREDHRYHGIDNAWIRVVSRGATALRVIYIRNGEEVLLYRAGPHSVEDNLAPPRQGDSVSVLEHEFVERAMRPIGLTGQVQRAEAARAAVPLSQASRFMKNHELRRLYDQILGRRLLPHKEIFLVSPFLTVDLLRPTKPLGMMLHQWLEDGCSVTLITKPPALQDLMRFDELEAGGFSIMYLERLHAKAYIFRLDQDRLLRHESKYEDLVVIGSANLTNSGFNVLGPLKDDPQLEISYQIASEDQDELDAFVTYLASVSISHEVFRHKLAN